MNSGFRKSKANISDVKSRLILAQIPAQFVETVLEIHQRYHDLVHKLFREEKHFIAALDKACSAIVNSSEPKRPCRAAELVSLTT